MIEDIDDLEEKEGYEPPYCDEEQLNKVYNDLKKSRERRPINTTESLRNTVMSFVGQQMEEINQDLNLKDLVKNEMARMVVCHEFDPAQILCVYNAISARETDKTAALLDIFKPTAQQGSVMLTQPTVGGGIDTPQLTATESQTIAKLATLLGANK